MWFGKRILCRWRQAICYVNDGCGCDCWDRRWRCCAGRVGSIGDTWAAEMTGKIFDISKASNTPNSSLGRRNWPSPELFSTTKETPTPPALSPSIENVRHNPKRIVVPNPQTLIPFLGLAVIWVSWGFCCWIAIYASYGVRYPGLKGSSFPTDRLC